MKKVCAAAPAKVILFGEHFVVKGVPAIASAISLYAKSCARPLKEDKTIIVKSSGIAMNYVEVWPRCSLEELCFLRSILLKIREMGIELLPAAIDVYSEIPVGSGMGSSAAVSVSFTAAYTSLVLQKELGLNLVESIAFEGERYIHGKPSGIDIAVAVYGGMVLFSTRKGVIKRIVPHLSKDVVLIVADTGFPRRTGEAVSLVLKRRERLGRLGEALYNLAENLVYEALKALERGDAVYLGELMDFNHGLLNALGVSTPEIEKVVMESRKAGALGAKLTGAGLGGSVVILAEKDRTESIIMRIRRYVARTYILNLGAPGLHIEHGKDVM